MPKTQRCNGEKIVDRFILTINKYKGTQSFETVAKRVGISRTAFYNKVNKKAPFTIEEFFLIMERMQFSIFDIDWILGGKK